MTFFFTPATLPDMIARFRKGTWAAFSAGRDETAAKFNSIAERLEELHRQELANQLAMPGEAIMRREELTSYRRMAVMGVIDFAARLGVAASELDEMEAGLRVIPIRFDESVVRITEEAINEMTDPGPL
jgi:hypothetical protein